MSDTDENAESDSDEDSMSDLDDEFPDCETDEESWQ